MARTLIAAQDHNLLISELQTLGVESKRRHPEVKEVRDQMQAMCLLSGQRPCSGHSQGQTFAQRDCDPYVISCPAPKTG